MIRLFLGGISMLCLLASGFLFWQTHGTLPVGAGKRILAYLDLFHEPVMAAALLAACFLFAFASACVTELLLGWIFAGLSALVSMLCLLGFLGRHYPPLAEYLGHILR